MSPSILRLATIIFFFVMSASISNVQAQKESEIVSRFRKALRKCAIDEPEPPIYMRGKISYGKMEFNGVVHYHKPNNRVDLSMAGMKFINFQNDSIRWSYNAATDEHEIQRISKEESEREVNREKRLDFASKDLLFYKERGFKLKSNGIQQLDSIKVYALDLTKPDGSVIQFFIETRSNLVYKIQSQGDDRYYTKYKVLGDYVYPHLMFTTISGNEMSMALEQVVINAKIADSVFQIPARAFEVDRKKKLNIESLLRQGDSLYSKGDYESSAKKYTDVFKYEGNNYRALNGRGLCKIQLKKYYEAISDFNEAIEIVPQGSRAINNRGLAKFYLGDNTGALEDYTASIKADSTFATVYKNRGLLYIRQKRFEESAADFAHAVKLNSTDGESHFKYAVAIAQLEKYDEALKSYNEAIRNDYKTAELYNYKGVSEFKKEQYDSAAASFRLALNMDAKNIQYIENLGNAYYYLSDYVQARKQFESYLKLKDDNAEIHNMIGLCKYKDEDYKGR